MKLGDIALVIIATLLLELMWSYDHQDRKALFDAAAQMCGGAIHLQSLQYGSIFGGFGFGCMPK